MLPFCVKPMKTPRVSIIGIELPESTEGQSPAFLPLAWTGRRWRPSHRSRGSSQATLSSAGSTWGWRHSGTGSQTKSPPSSGPEYTLGRELNFKSLSSWKTPVSPSRFIARVPDMSVFLQQNTRSMLSILGQFSSQSSSPFSCSSVSLELKQYHYLCSW